MPLPPPRMLRVYGPAGKLLVEAPAKSNAKRFSMRAHADQRQLDELIAQHPTATRAQVDAWEFVVINGRSSAVL